MSDLRRGTAGAVALASILFVPGVAGAAGDTNGYAGKGQLVVRTSLGGAEVTVGGEIAFEERGPQVRVDVVSLALPGTDPTLSSALSTQLFPPGGFTIVYDRGSGTYTVWSNARHTFYASAPSPASTAPPAPLAPAPAGTPLAGGDLSGAFAFFKSLKNDSAFSISLSLAGHGTVNGHPATGLDYFYARTTAGDATELHGRVQLADDLDGVPVEVTASGKSKSIPQSSLRLDLTTLARSAVVDAEFQVPAGFSRATNLGGVIGKTLPQ